MALEDISRKIDVYLSSLEDYMTYIIYQQVLLQERMIEVNGFPGTEWYDVPSIEITGNKETMTFNLSIKRKPKPGTILNPLPPDD